MKNNKGFTTKAIHSAFPKNDAYNSLHMPIYDGVAFDFENSEDMARAFRGDVFAHAYSRTSNPTVEFFESKLKNVTEAFKVVALSSGMAAISNALLSCVEPGDNIVSSNHLFGHTYALLKETLKNWGIEVRFANMSDLNDVKSKIDNRTRVVFFETITNPQLEIYDIKSLSNLAHDNNAVLVVDSTITPPYVFHSADFGVDVEVFSTTKFISGGAAAVGGAIVDNGTFDWSKLPALSDWYNKYSKEAFVSRIRKEIFRHLGGSMTAHTAHFLNLGLDILALRVDRCVDNCLRLGDFFNQHDKIKKVTYPGLKEHEAYDLSLKLFNGKPGAVMTIDLETENACFQLMDNLNVIRRATNLNDNKTLIIHPWGTIYAEFSDEEKSGMDIRNTMLRLSVGIEDVQDLIADFEQALAKMD